MKKHGPYCLILLAALVLLSNGNTAWAQENGFLKIGSNPPLATITIDGVEVGRTSTRAEVAAPIPVDPGEHDLFVFLEGVGDDYRTVHIAAGETVELFIDLVEVVRTASFLSQPAGARVTLNGQLIGQTPIDEYELEGEQNEAIFDKPCFVPVRKRVVASAGKTQTIRAELRQTVVPSSDLPPQIQGLTLCQDDRKVNVGFTLVPGPSGDMATRWDVAANLTVASGAVFYANMSGDLGDKQQPGPKTIVIDIPQMVDLNQRVALDFSVRPVGRSGSRKTVWIAAGGLLTAGIGVGAFLLFGGGDGGGDDPGIPLPPGRP